MRILFFTDSFHPELGGIQDALAAMCRGLGARGHEVLVCAPAASSRDYTVAGLPRREVDLGSNVQVRRLPSLRVPSSTRQSRLVLPTCQRWRGLSHFRPDVMHSHTFLGAGWEAVCTARRLRVPLVGTNHWAIGEFANYFPVPVPLFSRTSVAAVTWYYNHCDLVTGPSRSVIDEMRASGLRTPHCVVSNPIETLRFSPVPQSERARLKRILGLSPTTIIYAGRLAIEKRIDILIRAVALLRAEFPDVMLVLAGHGTARKDLEALTRTLGLETRVKFLGTLDVPALADAYRAADIFATASASETQSMALLQAMGTGLPAVGARWRALAEYVPDNAGLLAKPGEAGDFAEKLGRLLRDPPLREAMGAHAVRFVQDFTLAAVLDKWEEIYVSMAGATRESLRNAA